MKLVAAALLFASTSALADGEIRIDLELGKKREIDVGYVRGWMCDDPSLVTADMVTKDERNYWVVTGVKLGSTTCRVGTDPLAGHYVFAVRVVPAKKR